MRVYLAGTITKDPSTHIWRETAAKELKSHLCLNPLRGKKIEALSPDGLTSDIDPMLFVERDEKDIADADVVLLNALGMETLSRQSIGTWAEMGLARARHVPIVVITDQPSVALHPFVKKWAAAVVPTLEEAIKVVLWLR